MICPKSRKPVEICQMHCAKSMTDKFTYLLFSFYINEIGFFFFLLFDKLLYKRKSRNVAPHKSQTLPCLKLYVCSDINKNPNEKHCLGYCHNQRKFGWGFELKTHGQLLMHLSYQTVDLIPLPVPTGAVCELRSICLTSDSVIKVRTSVQSCF